MRVLVIALVVPLFLVAPNPSQFSGPQQQGREGIQTSLPRWHNQWQGGAAAGIANLDPAVTVDDQVGITFSQTFTSLAYNVTAVQQTDSISGTGPAYLLNGLSNFGYWYQVGLAWNWNPGTIPGTGFDMVYEVFSPSSRSIFPTNGQGGLDVFGGQVNQGDTVGLYLYFSGGNVVMYAKDLNTGASVVEAYSAFGAGSFVGLQSPANSNGLFTGLMTEWYHGLPHYGNGAKVVYSGSAPALSGGVIWADEFNVLTDKIVFAQFASYTFQVPLLAQGFSTNGTTAYASANQFITGQMNVVPLTASYAVAGGGSGYSPPTLVFTFNGATKTTPFTLTTPFTFYIDEGTQWSFSTQLAGSSASERWRAGQQSSGTAAGAQEVSLLYFHQYQTTFSYFVNGSGMSAPPSLTSTQFGSPFTATLATAPTGFWLDAGTPWAVTPNTLPGSTGTERWYASSASGVVSASAQLSVAYNPQFLFQVTGGGTPSQWYDSGTMAVLTTPKTFGRQGGTGSRISSYTLDGGSPVQVAPAPGNLSISVVMNGPHAIAFVSVVQYQLAVDTGAGAALISCTGPTIPSDNYWYDSGASASCLLSGVFGRSSGTGSRVSTYHWDDGATTSELTDGQVVTTSVVMASPHELFAKTATQYQVTLDPGATAALSSMTAPTVQGDDYWYDSGTPLTSVLNGIWNRSNGAGFRLSSYAVNGAATVVAAGKQVTVLNSASLASPVAISGKYTPQYLLTTQGGNLTSETGPAIPDDNGWYDSGTPVSLSYHYIWNVAGNRSRLNALGYSIDGGQIVRLARSAAGTFTLRVMMNASHAVDVASVAQYALVIRGGFDTGTSSTSPTKDGFFDDGTNLTASSDYTWNVVGGTTRQNLLSFTLDGATTSVPRADSGVFTTPPIRIDSYQELSFTPVTQYLISFAFTDGSGTRPLSPAKLDLQVHGGVQSVPPKSWMDSGSAFSFASVIWENADVKPLNQTYTVSSPANITISLRVYHATLEVTDFLGLAVDGARVSVALANETTVDSSTAPNGTADLGLIPLGTFHGAITNLGVSSVVSGDASRGEGVVATVYLSYAFLGLMAAVIAAVAAVAVTVLRMKSKKDLSPSGTGPSQPGSARCPNCGAPTDASMAFCENCGTKLH